MSSVSCLLEPCNMSDEDPALQQHQQRPNLPICNTIPETTSILRCLAVEEWINHSDDYQGFIGDQHNVSDKADKFRQSGYFFGPLSNTMVLAISNAIGIPVIIFSSAHHYPIICITPRVCRISTPLYIAYNQFDAGLHYDAVLLNDDLTIGRSHENSTYSAEKGCTCGKKSNSTSCVPLKRKYTLIVRCPCLLKEKGCTLACTCNNCNNPQGSKPIQISSSLRRKRIRPIHAWGGEKFKKSGVLATSLKERLTTGPHTEFEYLLISQILKCLSMKTVDLDAEIIHMIYSSCIEIANAFELSLPLNQKSIAEVDLIAKEYNKNIIAFSMTHASIN